MQEVGNISSLSVPRSSRLQRRVSGVSEDLYPFCGNRPVRARFGLERWLLPVALRACCRAERDKSAAHVLSLFRSFRALASVPALACCHCDSAARAVLSQESGCCRSPPAAPVCHHLEDTPWDPAPVRQMHQGSVSPDE